MNSLDKIFNEWLFAKPEDKNYNPFLKYLHNSFKDCEIKTKVIKPKNMEQKIEIDDLRITAKKNGKGIDVYLYDPLKETKLNVFLAYDTPNGDSSNDTETLLIYGN